MLKLKQGGQEKTWQPIDAVRSYRFNKMLSEKHIKQYLIADMLGMSPATISSFKNGKASINKSNVKMIADYLNVDFSFLWAEDILEHEEDLKKAAFSCIKPSIIDGELIGYTLENSNSLYDEITDTTSDNIGLDPGSVRAWMKEYCSHELVIEYIDYIYAQYTSKDVAKWHNLIRKLAQLRVCEKGKFSNTVMPDEATSEQFAEYLDEGIALLIQAYTNRISVNELSEQLLQLGAKNGSPITSQRYGKF